MTTRFLMWFIVLLTVTSALAAEPSPEGVAAMFEEGENQRAEKLKLAQQELATTNRLLAGAKAGNRFVMVNGEWGYDDKFRTPAEKERAIAEFTKKIERVEKWIANLKDPSRPVVPDIASFLIGQIGWMPFKAKVVRRLGDRQALLEVSADGIELETVYCEGIDFTKAVDGNTFSFVSSVYVSGSKTHGTRTVPLIEPIDLKPYIEKEQARRLEATKRKWISGTFSVDAIYVGFADGKVTLRKDDGTEVLVPLGKLSSADQAFVRKQIADAKSLK